MEKVLARTSARRQTSGDGGFEYRKLRQESGKITSSRYAHHRDDEAEVLLMDKKSSIIPRKRKAEM